MARSEEQYYTRIASIQQSMHKRERRRLELERELFSHSRCDRRLSQIKCSKLHSYLKEICDREARAKIRNLELLRDVECTQIGMKEYSPDHGPLQQQKVEFFRKISKFMEAREKAERAHNAAEVEGTQESHQVHPFAHPATDFAQPRGIGFVGHQTSRGPDAEAATTSVHSHQALHHSPNRSQHSGKHLPSGLLKDFRVGGGDAASNRAHLSDDISDSNDSPDGCNLSDKHERTMARLPSVPAAGSVPFGSDDGQGPSPLVTLTGPERNLSPSSSSPAKSVKNIPVEHTDSCEMAPQPLIRDGEENGVGQLMPETATEKDAQHTAGGCKGVSTAGSDVQYSESSESDLSLSLTQSELEEDPSDAEAPEKSTTSGGSDDRSRHSPESTNESRNSPQPSCESSAPAATLERLSQEGLFYLLDSIEGRLACEKNGVYGDSSIDKRQLNRIISLCNGRAGVNDEDLEACGAVVLRELQRLSWSTTQGCVLPQEVVSAHQSSTEPNEISASLTPDAARLWDRWFKHALLLKERRVLSTEDLVQLFTPLLLERHATHSHQAKVLLRTLVSRSSEECPSVEDQSDSSSSGGPSSPLADGDAKPARPVLVKPNQELQSSEEDSQDESPVESVPIRETKAYQLLKQSAMQKRLPSSEEEEDDAGLSGINHCRDEDLGRAKRSSHQDPYPRTNTTSSKVHSALRSKAFLCDSDESSSDIEAALRPQPLNTNADDFDDFSD